MRVEAVLNASLMALACASHASAAAATYTVDAAKQIAGRLALQFSDEMDARVRDIMVPLGQFLAAGQGGAGKAELDSVRATQKKYWKIFWEQPEIAAAIVTPSQRELIPMFKSMVATPMKEREHSQWQFGHPITFVDKPRTK